MDANTWPDHTGQNWKLLISVILYQYLGWNDIEALGCLYLAKAYWPNLKYLILCKESTYLVSNEIQSEGCSNLSKGYWPLMKQINLSKSQSLFRIQ